MDDVSRGVVWLVTNTVSFLSSPRAYILNRRRANGVKV